MQRILENIEEALELLRGKKVFLVHGRSFDSLEVSRGPEGKAVPLKTLFAPFDCVHFTDFTPNPKYEEVSEGVRLFRESKADVIVAVGGGSAMDVAKCVKLYCKMDPRRNYLGQEAADTGVELIAVPTTAGTGSESTRHAVIYFEGKKQSVSHPSIVPDTAVLEPALLRNLPLYQKKCTMLDAFCQGVESWWSVNSTEESRAYSKAAVTGIRDHWQAYLEGNEAAAKEILRAANFSGRAINITATTAPHAMSYQLTSRYHLPHGHAVAVAMERVWPYTAAHLYETVDPRGAAFVGGVLREIPVGPEWFSGFLRKLEIGSPASGNDKSGTGPGSREEEIRELASSVNPLRLKNHPVALSEEALKNLYEEIVK